MTKLQLLRKSMAALKRSTGFHAEGARVSYSAEYEGLEYTLMRDKLLLFTVSSVVRCIALMPAAYTHYRSPGWFLTGLIATALLSDFATDFSRGLMKPLDPVPDKKDWIIFRLVTQNCRARNSDHLDSGFIGAHADAMDHLWRTGMIDYAQVPDQTLRGRWATIKTRYKIG